MYLEKLANGVNPLTNEEVAENDVVNNVRISRCLFYTSGILKQIVENKGRFKAEMPDRAEFSITVEQLANYEYSEKPISITEVTKRVNDYADIFVPMLDRMYHKRIRGYAELGYVLNGSAQAETSLVYDSTNFFNKYSDDLNSAVKEVFISAPIVK